MTSPRPRRIRHSAFLLLAVLLTIACAVTWLLAEITCNLSEGQAPGAMDALCGDAGTPGRASFALVAAAIVPISYLAARRLDRLAVFAAGAAAGVLACASVWFWG